MVRECITQNPDLLGHILLQIWNQPIGKSIAIPLTQIVVLRNRRNTPYGLRARYQNEIHENVPRLRPTWHIYAIKSSVKIYYIIRQVHVIALSVKIVTLSVSQFSTWSGDCITLQTVITLSGVLIHHQSQRTCYISTHSPAIRTTVYVDWFHLRNFS